MGGDFNFYIVTGFDSRSSAQRTGNVQRKLLKNILHQNQLMDAWRIQHAKSRDYTFHSSVHGTYSRIDFFLVKHRLLETVINTNIEISTLSDHAPVSMRIKIE